MAQTRIVDRTPASTSQPDTSAMDAQLNALRYQIGQMQGATGIGGASQLSQLTAQYNNLLSQRNRVRADAAQQQQTNQNNAAQRQAEQARDRILGIAQGGIDRLQNDPTDQLLRQYLQGQMGAQVLDPTNTPFREGAPQFNAQGYQSQGITGQQGQSFTYNPERMEAQRVDYQDPFNAQTIQAMVNEQAAGAGAAESARNQLMRDAVLASGGNAFDPSLAAAQAESMAERNKAVANARNQINIVANRENAATRNAASLANAQFGQQAGQYNANVGNQAWQYNAGAQQQASFNNAQLGQQAGMFNAGAQNQANQFLASAQNQAGMFNTGNQMQAQNANFQAGNQARMYNQGIQSQAAGQLGSYNNQRQGMQTDAEGRLINVLGQQVFRGAETPVQQQQQVQMPTFQQWSAMPQSNVTYAPGYFGSATGGRTGTYQNPSIQSGLTGSVWAGSGQASKGSGTTTNNFASGYTGTPWNQQASQHISNETNRNFSAYPQQKPVPMGQLPQLPGVKQPLNYTARDF